MATPMTRPLRRNAMNEQGALYDLLANVVEAINERFPGTGLSLERAAAPSSTRLVALTGSTTITRATHEGRVLSMTGTGSAFTQTLPAATGSGDRYLFVVGAVNTSNHIITTVGNDTLKGQIITCSTGDTPDLAQPWTAGASDEVITLNGTTTGGQTVGDWVEVIDMAADVWLVRGMTRSSGSEATPFSSAA